MLKEWHHTQSISTVSVLFIVKELSGRYHFEAGL